jgi:hypothetical protein
MKKQELICKRRLCKGSSYVANFFGEMIGIPAGCNRLTG